MPQMQHCPEHSEMEETKGQSGLSCSQQEEVSITFRQIRLSLLDIFSLSSTLWYSLLGHNPGRVTYIMDETQIVFFKAKLQSTSTANRFPNLKQERGTVLEECGSYSRDHRQV